jgi:hypothetical protein
MTMIRKLVQAAISTLGPDEVEITMSTAALVRDGTDFGHMTEALLLVITLGLRRRLGRAPKKGFSATKAANCRSRSEM